MAITYANEVRKAALDAALALLNSGTFRLLTSGDAVLATLTFGATAFGAATTASPSVAVSNAITKDSSPTDGTFTKFELRTSGGSNRFAGSAGTSGTDLVVTSNVIPDTATEVSCPGGLTISLQLT
jgi:hypothetical protein